MLSLKGDSLRYLRQDFLRKSDKIVVKIASLSCLYVPDSRNSGPNVNTGFLLPCRYFIFTCNDNKSALNFFTKQNSRLVPTYLPVFDK